MALSYFLRSTPYTNEYLFAYQITCSVLVTVLIYFDGSYRLLFEKDIVTEQNWQTLSLLVVTSIVSWVAFSYSTFKARASMELVVVSVISKTKIVWSTLFGILIFSEKLTLIQCLGIVLILVASIMISQRSQQRLLSSSHLYAWIAPFCLTIAIGVDKALTADLPSSLILFFGFTGTTVLIPFMLNIRFHLMSTVIKSAFSTAVCGSFSYYLLLTVLNVSSFSLAMALLQSAFILDVLFSILFLKERNELKKKIVSCVVATAGVLVLIR